MMLKTAEVEFTFPSAFVAVQWYTPLSESSTSSITSSGETSLAILLPSLNQAMVGCGLPVAIHLRTRRW